MSGVGEGKKNPARKKKVGRASGIIYLITTAIRAPAHNLSGKRGKMSKEFAIKILQDKEGN